MIFVSGEVKITDLSGQTRAAAKNTSLNEGDTVTTAPGASAQLRMTDGGFIAVRPDTQMKFDKYRFSGKEDGKENALMSLLKGGFRTITGVIGRTNKNNYIINTPVATIGIRGTDHEVHHELPPLTGRISLAPPGSYNKVNVGITAMTTSVGTTIIGANQVGFAGGRNETPRLLPVIPLIFKVAQAPAQTRAAAPAQQQGGREGQQGGQQQGGREGQQGGQQQAGGEQGGQQQGSREGQQGGQQQAGGEQGGQQQAGGGQAGQGGQQQAGGEQGGQQQAGGGQAGQGGQQQAGGGSTGGSQPGGGSATGGSPPAGGGTGGGAPTFTAAPETVRNISVVDNTAGIAAGVATASAPPPATGTGGTGIGGTVLAGTSPTTSGGSTAPAGDSAAARPITATTETSTGDTATLNTATQTVAASIGGGSATVVRDLTTNTDTITTATGTVTVPVTNTGSSGGGLTLGDPTTLANLSVTGTTASQTSINAISTALAGASGTTPTVAFNAINAAYGTTGTAATVQGDAAAIAAIAAVDTTTAANNLATVTTKAGQAASAVTAASAVNTANSNVANGVGGTDFRDTQAAAALAAMNTANTTVQGAKTTATTASGDASTQSTALGTAKSSATTQLATATPAFNTAQSTLNALTAAANVDAGLTNPNQTVSNLLALAGNAVAAANTAATAATNFQAASDFTNAFAQAAVAEAENKKAQSYLALAQQIQTVINQGGTVGTAQTTLATLKTNATTAKGTGDAAVATTTTELATATSTLPTVQSNAVVAQYSNPTVVSANRFTSIAVGATSAKDKIVATAEQKANTNYVLDGTKNLVEARVTDIASAGGTGAALNLAGADVKVIGGVAADNTVVFDPSSANAVNYMAMGRWTGTAGSPLTVDANGTILTLGTNSLHWMAAYAPPTSYVQSRAGTSAYTKFANTSPTDALGNVGTLNSATLSVNFDTQQVSAGVNATVAAKTVSGSGTFAISPAIQTFGGNFTTVTAGWSGDLKGAFAGDKATGAGFGYNFWTPMAGITTDLIQGVVAFSTATAPPQADFAVVAAAADTAATAAKNSINTISTALAGSAGTTPTAAFGTANTAYGTTGTAATVQGDATTIAAIAAIDTATAGTNLTNVTAKATLATTAVNTATPINVANSNVTNGVGGTDFRDSTAVTAFTNMTNANTTVQGNKTTATTASGDASTQAGLLGTSPTTGYKGSAATQLTTGTGAFNTAQSTLNALTAAANVDGGATNPNQTVTNLLSLATTAATNAHNASLSATANQGLGTPDGVLAAQVDMQTAQAENAKAQAYLALAQQIQTVINQGGTVGTAQTTLATLKTNATTAKGTGDAAVATTTTELATATSTLPTVQSNAVVAQYSNPTIATANRFGSIAVGATSTNKDKIVATADVQPNTNYVLDGGTSGGTKNLVEARVTDIASGQFSGGIPLSAAGADMKVIGGVAADNTIAFDPTAGAVSYIAMGRWTGTAGSPLTVDANGTILTLGTNSLHWMTTYLPPPSYVQSRGFVTAYTKFANTSPTDAFGNVGVLNSATLSADFTNQQVTAGVDVTVATKNVAGSGIFNITPATPYFVGNFTTGLTTGWTGDLKGAFAGDKAQGAGFTYNFWPTATTTTYTDLIQGVVGFSTATAPLPKPQPDIVASTAYAYGTNTWASTYYSRGVDYILDAGAPPNLVSVAANPLDGRTLSEANSGGTAQNTGTITSAGSTVLNFGRWQGGTVAYNDGTPVNRTVVGSEAWIYGPTPGPFYLGRALAGAFDGAGVSIGSTLTYTNAGGVPPTDSLGNVGVVNNAALSVNFTKQAVTFGVNATVNGNIWDASATDVRLMNGTSFFAVSSPTTPHSALAVTLGGSATGTYGSVGGNLMGVGLDAAGLTYALGQSTTNFVSGAVAFTGTAQPTAQSYTVGLLAAGRLDTPVTVTGGAPDGGGGFLPPTATPVLSGGNTLTSLDAGYLNVVATVVSSNTAPRTKRDSSGMVFGFDASVPATVPLGCTSGCTGVTQTPATLSVQPTNYTNPDASPPQTSGAMGADALANYTKDPATAINNTGIQWGRYVGFISYTDRIGATNGIPAGAFDARTSNWHGIWMNAQTAAPVLPVSGTFAYTKIGNTDPTDQFGTPGGVLNSASLTANFTTMKVDTAVNLTVNAATWTGSATGVDIQNASFNAQKGGGLNNLAVTTTLPGATTTAGTISGVFTGNSAFGSASATLTGPNKVQGAMIGYSLSAAGTIPTTVSGVAAFRK